MQSTSAARWTEETEGVEWEQGLLLAYYPKGYVRKLRLLFEPKLAVYITERQWHPSQEFHMRRDGRVLMRFKTTGRKEVVCWVLSWMPDVEVLGPKSLRDRVCEKLEAGLRSQ